MQPNGVTNYRTYPRMLKKLDDKSWGEKLGGGVITMMMMRIMLTFCIQYKSSKTTYDLYTGQ